MVAAMDNWYAIFTLGVMGWFLGFPGYLILGLSNTRQVINEMGGLFWLYWFGPILVAAIILVYFDNKAWQRVKAGTDKTENKNMAIARQVIDQYIKRFDGRRYIAFNMDATWLEDAHMSLTEFLNMIPSIYRVTRSEYESKYIGRDETLYLYHIAAELITPEEGVKETDRELKQE